MKLMIEFHRVPHELQMYIEDIRGFGEIIYHSDSLPHILYLETLWEADIIESVYGVKKVREPKYDNTAISINNKRKWLDIIKAREEREFEP